MTMARPRTRRQDSVSTFSWPVDPVALVAAGFLLVCGLVMVASASSEISLRLHGTPIHMLAKHGIYVLIAIAAGGLVLNVPIAWWQRLAYPALALSVILLGLVLVPGIGREVNGSVRWIALGPVSLQGSEFVKLFTAVFIAAWLVRHNDEVRTRFVGIVKPLAVTGILVLMLLAQPDFGASVVIMGTVLGMLFFAGASMLYFVPMIVAAVVMAGSLVILQPERFDRFIAFLDPWAHQFDGGYQLTQALIAFGRGDWLGLGLGNSIQKIFFLPEAHTDFLFSIIAEELGVAGALVIIIAFACLVLRAVWIGQMAENRGESFHAYLAYGIALLLGIQATINMGVNMGLLPTKGLTLPLMSYGGNSLIVSCMLIAVLLRIEWECRRAPVGRSRKGGRRGKR